MTATYPGTSSGASVSANQTKSGEVTLSTGNLEYADGPSVALTVPAGCDFVLVYASVEIGPSSVSDCVVGLESTATGTPDLTDPREQLLEVPFDGVFGANLVATTSPVIAGGAEFDMTNLTALGLDLAGNSELGAGPIAVAATPNTANTFSLVYQNSNPLAGDAAVANRKLYVWVPADFS